MHGVRAVKNLLRFLESEEASSRGRIGKIYIRLSEFGGITKEHFMEHFRSASKGTRWDALEVEFEVVPFGPEFTITKMELI